MSQAIFISYRHVDSALALHLQKELCRTYAAENIFYDVDRVNGIPPSADFLARIHHALSSMEIQLILIGPGWMEENQLQRLFDRDDVVRQEIARGLERRRGGEALTLLPILCGDTPMPNRAQLPPELEELPGINAIRLHVTPSEFDHDLQEIHKWIDRSAPNLRARICNRWLLETLSDAARSRSRLGQNIALADPKNSFIPRQEARQAISAWWNNWPQQHQCLMLLGNEGDGKSWAIADWLVSCLSQPEFPTPMIYAPTPRLASASLLHILAEGLALVRGGNPEQHRATLREQLRQAGLPVPAYVLVIDALNERPSLNWREFFDELRLEEYRQRIAVVVLCREGYWKDLNIPEDDLIRPWILGEYNDEELETLLAGKGSSRQEIASNYPQDIQTFLRRPRYFDLAFRLKDEVGQGGLTLERLIYEDWRDLSSSKRHIHFDHESFLTLLQDLAKDFADRHFSRAVLGRQVQALGANIDDLRVELTSTGIISQTGTRLLIGKDHLSLALGLVLAQEVEEAADLAHGKEVIAKRLKGCSESDLQVKICAMALFVSLNTEGYPDEGRFALLAAWIEGRNLAEDDLRRIPAYFPLRPQIYLRLAELLWGNLDNREAQDYFMAGLLQHRDNPSVEPLLCPTFARWLGLIHPLGRRILWNSQEFDLEEYRKALAERLVQEARPGRLKVLDVELEIVEDTQASLLRLAPVALAVISHGCNTKYAPALATGLVASAAMKQGLGDFYWVLQLAPAPLRQAMLEVAEKWQSFQQPLALAALMTLIRALDHESANRRYAQQLRELREQQPQMRHFPLPWKESEVAQHLAENPGLSADQIAEALQKIALNPAYIPPSGLFTRLENACMSLDFDKVAWGMGFAIEDRALEDREPALCAFAPERYAALMRKLAKMMKNRRDIARQMLSSRALDHFPVLDDEEREIIHEAWLDCVQNCQSDRKEIHPDKAAELYLFPGVLFVRSAQEQIQLILDRNTSEGHWCLRTPLYQVADSNTVGSALLELKKIPFEEQRFLNLLDYLSETLTEPLPELRAWLLENFHAFHTTIRGLCLQLFCRRADREAAQTIIASSWQADFERITELENVWGSILLSRFGEQLPFPVLASRILPEYIGYAVKARGCRRPELEEYQRLITAWLQDISTRTPSSSLTTLAARTMVNVKTGDSEPIAQLSSSRSSNGAPRFNNATWGGNSGKNDIDASSTEQGSEAYTAELNRLSRQILELKKNERARGNHWFGFSFQGDALEQLVATDESCWEHWIAPVLENSAMANRLLASCRGFYEKLCSALLAHSPADGVRLYQAIARHPNVRITDSRFDLPVLLLETFASPSSPELDDLPEGLLAQITSNASSDKELFQIAMAAQWGKRFTWLRKLIDHWLASDWEFNQARALTLLGFSIRLEDHERLDRWISEHEDCWTRTVAIRAAQRAQRLNWARIWFQRFLERENRIESWAAFRLFLRCTDRRVWLWLRDTDLTQSARWKQEAFNFCIGTVVSACKEGEKAWQDEFIGHKVKIDEYWPWMSRFQA